MGGSAVGRRQRASLAVERRSATLSDARHARRFGRRGRPDQELHSGAGQMTSANAHSTLARRKFRLSALLVALACAPAAISPSDTSSIDLSARRLLGPATPGASTPLSAADERWVERTLASLTLREKVG